MTYYYYLTLIPYYYTNRQALCRYAYSLSTNGSAVTPATTNHRPTIDRADTPAIHRLLVAPYCHPLENDSAGMPAIYRPIDSSSSVFDLLSPPDACTVLLPDSTVAALPTALQPTTAALPAVLPSTPAAPPAAFHLLLLLPPAAQRQLYNR